MVSVKFQESNTASCYGLTQWDYGQTLMILTDSMIPDGAEVQFYQGLLSSTGITTGGIVKIPDKMLQNTESITAYIYVRSETAGETILTAALKITARPRPENYILPEYTDYGRLPPVGGISGQVMGKKSDADNDFSWIDKADNVKVEDGMLQLLSGGRAIGDRVRIAGAGTGGREVELRKGETAIEWRYTDENEWHELISLSDLKGEPGETPEFELRDGHLFAIYQH